MPQSPHILHAHPWRELDTPDAIRAWDALALWPSEPNPFFESWFLLPALRALDPGGAQKILCLRVDGRLAGLLPLAPSRRYYTRPIPHLASWLHPNCFLGAPLVARGQEQAFWRALLAWADAQGGLSLFLHLAALPLSGALADALRAVLAEQTRPAALVHTKNHVILHSAQSPQAYYEANVSAKKRKEYRRQANRLAELGTVAVERQTGSEHLDHWIETFLALEASGWKGKAGSALASAPATTALWQASLTGAAARHRLERLALTLDGRPIAMLATFLAPPAAVLFKTTYAEHFAPYSPGVLLQRENLAMLTAPGITFTDSCAGEDHPMIPHLWSERRPVGAVSIAIGGAARRGLFTALARRELGHAPLGI